MPKQRSLAPILVIVVVAVLIFFVSPFVYKAITGKSPQRLPGLPPLPDFPPKQCPQEAQCVVEEEIDFEKIGEKKFSQEIVEEARKVGIKVRKSVVVIGGRDPEAGTSGRGTAFFIKEDILITAGHNLGDDIYAIIEAYSLDGKKFKVKRVGYSLTPDIGVLKAQDYKGIPLRVGSTDKLEVGQPLLQVGHPGGIDNWAIMLGSLVRKAPGGIGFLSTIPDIGGVSGAPVLTLDGKVVGVTSGSTQKQTYNAGTIEDPPKDSTVFQTFPKGRVATHEPMEMILAKMEEWLKRYEEK